MRALYQRYYRRLHAHACRMLRDEAEAQDVVQEAFARALESIHRTGQGLRFRGWIFRITTNLCLRHLNRRRRWVRAQRPQADPHPAADPEHRRRQAEMSALAKQALSQMPARYQQVLLLREVQELSHDELARALDLDKNRVKVTLHRARARFAAYFIAEQLLGNPGQPVQCQRLRRLLSQRPRTSSLVKHLESCPRCRRRERRPTRDLVGLLPILPTKLPQASGQAAGHGWTKLVGALGGNLARAMLFCAALASSLTALLLSGDAISHVPPSTLPAPADPYPAAGFGPGASEPMSWPTTLPPSSFNTTSAPMAPVSSEAPSALRPLISSEAHSSPKRLHRPRKKRHQAQSRSAPSRRLLALQLRFAPGTLLIKRRGQVFRPGKRHLRLGDVLVGSTDTRYALWFPGGRRISAQGLLRLDKVPFTAGAADRDRGVQLTLLSGEVRARTATAGRGLVLALGASRVEVQGGEARVRKTAQGFWLESLGAYVTARGNHATRVVPPSTGLLLARRAGFAHQLLPEPIGLLPLSSQEPAPPLLRWDATPNARSYVVQIARDPEFMLPPQRSLQVSGLSTRPTGLEPSRYFWRVMAINGERRGRPSRTHSFEVLESPQL